MFAHKEISHKVHRPTRSENARHILVWVYRKRCERKKKNIYIYIYFVCVLSVLYTVSVLILRGESFSSLFVRHYTILCAHKSKRRACVRFKRLRMRDEDLTVICDRTEKKSSRNFNLGGLPWKARVIKYNAYLD